MYENAQEIFNYLPIRKNKLEQDYIEHLWKSYAVLDEGDEISRPFAVMPFHLLFMLAIQYRVLRIYKEQKEKYGLVLTTKNPRDEERDILAPESPFAIAFLGESEIVDFLKIAGLSSDDARSIKKSIIRYRNDKIAHAKGFIETNIEKKITEYFEWLETLQTVNRLINQCIANAWLTEIQIDDNLDEFLEARFLNSCITPKDLRDIFEIFIKARNLNLSVWLQVAEKCAETKQPWLIKNFVHVLKS